MLAGLCFADIKAGLVIRSSPLSIIRVPDSLDKFDADSLHMKKLVVLFW